uniref:Uncharacterized protein n=1 Tax=Anopheles funestus TaxID=62324 RepID=A0A182RJB6_ANOFN
MYNQAFNTTSYGVGYGGAEQQQYYYQQQQQQQYQQQHAQKQQQQMIAGIMGYYPPEAAAMFYNPYTYGHDQSSAQQYAQQQQLDYQLTPALYLLNQQAELLQKTLAKDAKKPLDGTMINMNKPQRKQRGPYKKRTNKTLSPTVSPAPEFVTDTECLSSSDLSNSNNRSTGSIHTDLSIPTMDSSYPYQQQHQQQQQMLRKRKSDSCLEVDQQEQKHCRTLSQKQSIFRDVALMAVSSCTAPAVQ